MKITFIRPNMPSKRSGSVIEPLSIAILKAQTPEDVELSFYDEFIEAIPEHIETDLIAITVQTFTAFRAYQIADRFRQQRIPVVMGGIHPTLMPDEAIKHADAVVLGDGERIWEKVVSDAKNGQLKQFYQDPHLTSLNGVQYDRSIFKGKGYSKVLPIEFNRGCIHQCDFCSVSVFNNHKVKSRSVDEVVAEMKGLKNKYFLFIDDNICINKEKTSELFQAIIPLKRKWGCQICIDTLKDESFVKLMSQSGCIVVMVGFESLHSRNLEEMNKKSNLRNDYAKIINMVKKYGIMVWGSFILGCDHDDLQVLRSTYEFATKNRLYLANFNTLNPMPGTKLYERMKQEKRLSEDAWWCFEKYKYGEIMFRPKTLTSQKLKQECIRLRLDFNKYSNIFYRALDKRANCKNFSNFTIFLASNIAARRQIFSKMEQIM